MEIIKTTINLTAEEAQAFKTVGVILGSIGRDGNMDEIQALAGYAAMCDDEGLYEEVLDMFTADDNGEDGETLLGLGTALTLIGTGAMNVQKSEEKETKPAEVTAQQFLDKLAEYAADIIEEINAPEDNEIADLVDDIAQTIGEDEMGCMYCPLCTNEYGDICSSCGECKKAIQQWAKQPDVTPDKIRDTYRRIMDITGIRF